MHILRSYWKIGAFGVAVIVATAAVFAYLGYFGAPGGDVTPERFIISQGETLTEVLTRLKSEGFVKSIWALGIAVEYAGGTQGPGGYKISKSMDTWTIAQTLAAPPYMRWVTIPEGLRKEEIAGILQKKLGWTDAQKSEWINIDTSQNPDNFEGVYFPSTYLIPVADTPEEVATLLINKFNEEFAPYAKEALAQNVKWTTVVKLASIIQREAAGKDDMPLIAGVLWNRLEQGMLLGIDATVQYARGDTGKGWWAPITVADKAIKSPYNTYMYTGLPPHPISNPGIDAIAAVLAPAKTACLYYLHDKSGTIHCAATYAEHQANINTYLK